MSPADSAPAPETAPSAGAPASSDERKLRADDARASQADEASRRGDKLRADDAPFTVAGAAAAGYVGGMLIAVPVFFATLPAVGPLVGGPVAIAVLAGGAAFGGFVGELAYARVATAALVAGTGAAGTLVGASVGIFAGGALGALVDPDGAGLALGILGGAAIGGLAGAATGAGLGALWLTPDER